MTIIGWFPLIVTRNELFKSGTMKTICANMRGGKRKNVPNVQLENIMNQVGIHKLSVIVFVEMFSSHVTTEEEYRHNSRKRERKFPKMSYYVKFVIYLN